MTRNLSILGLLTLVVGLPFLFRNEKHVPAPGSVSVVIVSPHNESIRHEFGRGFREWYREQTGKDVYVDCEYWVAPVKLPDIWRGNIPPPFEIIG